MGIPVDQLLEDSRNPYEVTAAMIHRSAQIGEVRRAFSSDEHGSVSDEGEKIVSQSIREVVLDEVRFMIDAE